MARIFPLWLGLTLALFGAAAQAQVYPNIPPNTFLGRLGSGVAGPPQAIPLSSLLGNVFSSMSGDCTMSPQGVITCLSTNSTPFGTAATVNTGTSGATLGLLSNGLTFSGSDNFIGGWNCTGTCTYNGNQFGTFATQNYATPPAIGGTTPNTGAFTTLTATTPATGDNSTKAATTAFVNAIFAAPPAYGSTTPAAVSATTLSGTTLAATSGVTFSGLASPGTIAYSVCASSAGVLYKQSGTNCYSNGSATAGGSNTNVQYNSSGVLAGSNSFVFNGTDVGIGTTSPSFTGDGLPHLAVASATAHGFGEIGVGGNITSVGDAAGNFNFYNPNLGTTDKRIGAISVITNGATNSGQMDFFVWNAGSAVQAETILPNGNVGFGAATSPAALLHVASSTGGTPILSEFQDTTGAQEVLFQTNAGGGNFGTHLTFEDGATASAEIDSIANGGLHLSILGTVAMAIDGSQRVGIQTTTPSQPLEVNGTILSDTNIVAKANLAVGYGAGSPTVPTDGANIAGNVYLGGGQPWADVKSGSNGCAVAVGDGSTIDRSAIQCQINYMQSIYGGGAVFLPCGSYQVSGSGSGGISVSNGIMLIFEPFCSSIVDSSDETAVTLTNTASGVFTGMRDGQVYCDGVSTSATGNCVIGAAGRILIENSRIEGGKIALVMEGTDGYVVNSSIDAAGSGGTTLYSDNGANWYIRDKLDLNVNNESNCVLINTSGSGVNENHFFNVDCSGGNGFTYSNSWNIDDNGSNHAKVVIDGQSILSAPAVVSSAKFVTFLGDEMNAVATNSDISIVGGTSDSAVLVTGSGTCKGAANWNISGLGC